MKIHFAPRHTTHLFIATLMTLLLSLLVSATVLLAADTPDAADAPTAYAVCGGQIDDWIVARADGTTTIIADEGEGRAAQRLRNRVLRIADRKGLGVCTTPGILWIGSGFPTDDLPEGGWIRPGIIKQGGR